MIITGIGSRETPQNILDEMVKIGRWCFQNNVIIRSGHAEGADFAFEQGAQEKCIAFIPWSGFNETLSSKAQLLIIKPNKLLTEITNEFHPNPVALRRGGFLLMCRNAVQVLGEDGNSPTKAVVCWTENGKDAGGTGQAIRIAEFNEIPVFNMFYEEFSTAEKIVAELIKIK